MKKTTMRLAALAALVCMAGCGSAAPAGSAGRVVASAPADLVIRDVRLFDGDVVHERATVVVRDGRIAAVGQDLVVPEAAEVVDGAGHTLIPGLIDAHAHTFAEPALVASLAFGVTTVLDQFSAPALARGWRQAQDAGRAAGRADLFTAGVLATAAGGHGTQYGMPIPTVDSPEGAAAWVAARAEEGSDWIKIVVEDGSSIWPDRTIPTLDAARVNALVDAAHDHGLLAVAHVARLRDARMAMDAGADGLVHLWMDRTPEAALARRMAASGMFVVPTLTVLQSVTGGGGAELLDDPRVDVALDTEAAANLRISFPTGPGRIASYDSALSALAALHIAGVTIVAGTDAPNPGTTHGASMHRELALLVEAGLTPVEALAAATSSSAAAFRLDDRGRIEAGRRADLVLVRGDPTTDITATREIVRIWKGGTSFDRPAYVARVSAARAERAAAAAAPGRGPGPISDFDDGTLAAAFGAGWSETTDAMMGGTSTVDVAVEPAGSGMALRVRGETKAGTPFPWSGVMFAPGATAMAPVNLAGSEGIVFRVRGDGSTYQALLFHEAGGFAPVVAEFVAGPEWAEVVIPWSAFSGADGRGVMGVAFVAGSSARTFEFWLDDVALR